MTVINLALIILVICAGWLFLIVIVYKIIGRYDQITEIKARELGLICVTLLVTIVVSAFVVHDEKIFVYWNYVLQAIVYGIFRNVVLAGLFAGFITTANLGYLYYIFVVPRFVFDNFEDSFFLEHHQKRVGAMASFLIGQLVMFTSVYNRPIHRRLIKPDCIFLLFIIHFVIQVLWVRITIVRNWRFLYPNDKRKRVVRRIILLQVEFMCNFFLQLALLPSNSYIKLNSQVHLLIKTYIKKRGNKIVANIIFIKASFFGWLIGQIFFMIFYIKLFQFVVIITIRLINWLRKKFKL